MAIALALTFATALCAQVPQSKPTDKSVGAATQTEAARSPEAKVEDVKNINSIIAALYDVISGAPGARDWNRFHSLFIPGARLIAIRKLPDGTVRYRVITPDEYEQNSGAYFLKNGFFERGIHNTIEEFGQEAHVISSYESRHEKDAKPFARGINSIQLLNDGKRWWVVTIMWDEERTDMPIPDKYLK